MSLEALKQSPEWTRGGREVIEHCIDGYYIDPDLMRGNLWVTVRIGDGNVSKQFALKHFETYADALTAARGWRDALLGARSKTPVTLKAKPKKRVRVESPAVELARRDVAGAMRKYGHAEVAWWTERTYIP